MILKIVARKRLKNRIHTSKEFRGTATGHEYCMFSLSENRVTERERDVGSGQVTRNYHVVLWHTGMLNTKHDTH